MQRQDGLLCCCSIFRMGKPTSTIRRHRAGDATPAQQEVVVITPSGRATGLVFIEGAGSTAGTAPRTRPPTPRSSQCSSASPCGCRWSRADETARAPKSPPRTIDLEAGLDAQGDVVAWTGDFYIALNHIAAFKPLDFPLLAATEHGIPRPGNRSDSTVPEFRATVSVSEHPCANTRHIAEAFFRSSHLRSPGRIENSYANEGFMDELAAAANADPAEFRLRYLKISARSTFSRRR